MNNDLKYNIIKYLPIEEQFLLGHNKNFIKKIYLIFNEMYIVVYNDRSSTIRVPLNEKILKNEKLYYLSNYKTIIYYMPREGFYLGIYERIQIYKLYYEKTNNDFIIVSEYDVYNNYGCYDIIDDNNRKIAKYSHNYYTYSDMLGKNEDKIIYNKDKIFYLIDIEKMINYL